MVKSGCDKLQCGGESGSNRILKFLRKGIKVKDIYNFVRRCKKFNITPLVAFMTGLPTETRKEQMETIRVIRDLLIIDPKVNINGPANFRPYPGGELYKFCVENYNLKLPNSLEEWATVKIMGGSRPPWVKRRKLIVNKYLWTSILATKLSLKDIKKSEPNIIKRIALSFLTILAKIRIRYVFYRFPIEFILMEIYNQYISKTIIEYS